MDDARIIKILQVLQFFHEWKNSFEHLSFKDKSKYLITRETREDIRSVPHNLSLLISNYHLFRRPPSTPKITPLTQC